MVQLRDIARRAYGLWLKAGETSGPVSAPGPVDQATVERMREDWNRRASENAKHYVHNERIEWADRDFFRTGEINVAKLVMTGMPRVCGPTRSPLDLSIVEIGCGVGRMTRMLARIFGKVTALDISDEMVAHARANTADLPNVEVLLGDGATLEPLASDSYDFVFSFIVFQHVPSLAVIGSYCREAHRVLRPGGLFKFQVQGRTYFRRGPRDTWIGYQVSPSQAGMLARNSGFVVEHSEGPGTQYYWLWFRKPLGDAAE
jgi:SAM-dependent methyltransferase